jgi:copper(I)-binding protein/cytochrome c-type biogenesis protein CcmH/NrfF
MQDSIIGVALPAPLGALYRDLLSPYCPGLSLATCPSPQADSLRKAIAVRFNNGEPINAITESLVAHYGPNIRGSPTMDGFGAVAFLVPAMLFVGGGLFILRWLRRNTARRAARGAPTVLLAVTMGGASLGLLGCGSSADSSAADPLGDNVRVESAWVRVGSAGTVTGAYGTVYNPSTDTLQIVGASSAVADTVELHETMEHDGMVHMAPQPALAVLPRDSVVLTPGGLHLMVRALQRDLIIGETVQFTLQLGDGRAIDFPVEVRSLDGRTVATTSRNASGAPRMSPGRKTRSE